MKVILWVVAALGALALYVWLVSSGAFLPTIAGDELFEEGSIEVPYDAYNPVLEGEETPDGFRQLLGRDVIRPVYTPTFKSAADTDWGDDTLVIGVALDGEAKAYPVSLLNHREMVIDWIGGTPVLVSW